MLSGSSCDLVNTKAMIINNTLILGMLCPTCSSSIVAFMQETSPSPATLALAPSQRGSLSLLPLGTAGTKPQRGCASCNLPSPAHPGPRAELGPVGLPPCTVPAPLAPALAGVAGLHCTCTLLLLFFPPLLPSLFPAVLPLLGKSSMSCPPALPRRSLWERWGDPSALYLRGAEGGTSAAGFSDG